MRRIIALSIAIPFFLNAEAKRPLTHIGIAVNNFVCAKPVSGFSKLFYSQFHPGITISSGFNWTQKPKHSLMQGFKIGYFSHRYIQRSFTLYSEFGYRYKASQAIAFTAALGGGYLHMIPATHQFRQNEDGEWEKIKLRSRPQAMISISLGIDWKLGNGGNRMFIRYQNILQTPFVPGYVPLLPYNVLHFGFTVPVSALRKGVKDAK